MTTDSDSLSAIAGLRDDSPMAVARRLLAGDDGGLVIDTVADRRIETGVTSGAMCLRALLDGFGLFGDRPLPPADGGHLPPGMQSLESDTVQTRDVSRAGALYEQF